MSRDRTKPRLWHTDFMLLRGLARLMHENMGPRLKPGQRLIDMGCGDQPYRALVTSYGAEYVGADIDDGADVKIEPNGQVALPAHQADHILSVQVLEHVFDLEAYFYEIRRLLKDDGTLFLSTHGTWLYHPHPEDHRRWTRTGLAGDMEANGFRVEEMHAIAGPLATTTVLRLTGFAFVLRKIPVAGPLLAGGLAILMNLRALLEDAITPSQMRMDNACIYWVRASPI